MGDNIKDGIKQIEDAIEGLMADIKEGRPDHDARWLEQAKLQFDQGAMALRRAIQIE